MCVCVETGEGLKSSVSKATEWREGGDTAEAELQEEGLKTGGEGWGGVWLRDRGGGGGRGSGPGGSVDVRLIDISAVMCVV